MSALHGSHFEGHALTLARFETACVGIVGLGGGGSHIVQQLAHIGIHYFTCFDGDVVEYTNLNRLVGAIASDVADRILKWRLRAGLS